jgi:hypothetical protein
MTQAPRPDYLVGLMAVIVALGCAWTARRSGPFVFEAAPLPGSAVRQP